MHLLLLLLPPATAVGVTDSPSGIDARLTIVFDTEFSNSLISLPGFYNLITFCIKLNEFHAGLKVF
jgi:hypothetical protein